MVDNFIEKFGFRPGSLNPLFSGTGFMGGMEADLVALKLRTMKEAEREVEDEIKKATNNRTRVFWLGVLESMRVDTHNAKKLAREFEFLG